MTSIMDVTEAAFQQQVIQLAQALGWRVAHFRAAQTGRGWRTPVQADGAGFPDLVLVRERVIFAELKSRTGKLSDDQGEWHLGLRGAGAEAYVWRPADLQSVADTLARRTR